MNSDINKTCKLYRNIVLRLCLRKKIIGVYSYQSHKSYISLIFYRITAERRKQDDYDESEAENVLQTAMEAEDLWENELNKFTPASRLTG